MMLNKDLYNMIFKRKSFHIFRNVGNEKINEEEIKDVYEAYEGFSSLNPEIKTKIKIVPNDKVTTKRGQEMCILLYSEKKDGYLQNIGYLGQQLDLYLVSKNIGTLWFGIGKTEEICDGLDYVIMFAVKKVSDPKKYRKDMFKSKRKDVDEIWSGEYLNRVTDIVRFAPSACNSQPWKVVNDGGTLRVYRYKKEGKRGIMPADKVSFYNRIDIGIFMCFMELCMEKEGITYERRLFSDEGKDDTFTLNAEYEIR
ncbi:MAG: nitroreductase [Ruminococcaceae bacterium]|nr:nitroreductase [Oscillospiraceae bacterium]